MPTVLSDGCVLLPHLPNWAEPIEQGRWWETGLELGLTSAEDRQALRPSPNYLLSWSVLPFDQREGEILQAAIRAAKKEGNAAAPWWGRGYKIGASGVAPGAATIPISALIPAPWLPVVGDEIFAASAVWTTAGGATWELWTVDAVTIGTGGADHSITITSATALQLSGGALAVWPLLRGRFDADETEFRTPTMGIYRLHVRQPMGINPGISVSPDVIDAPVQIDGMGIVIIAQDDMSESVQIDGIGLVIIAMD